MKRLRWTEDAADDLVEIIGHIQEERPAAGRDLADKLLRQIERLEAFPRMGRVGEVKGSYELVSPPYIVVYRIRAEVVELLHIFHGARDWR